MLSTSSPAVVGECFDALIHFGSDQYIPALQHQLGSTNEYMLRTCLDLAEDHPQPELAPSLNKLLLRLDSQSILIWHAVQAMHYPECVPSIQQWLNELYIRNRPHVWDEKICNEIIDIFSKIDPDSLESEIEQLMFFWTGADSTFVKNSDLLTVRRSLEKELCDKVRNVLPQDFGKTVDVKSIVFLQNRFVITEGSATEPHYNYHVQIIIQEPHPEAGAADTQDLKRLRRSISEASGIPFEKLGLQLKGIYPRDEYTWYISNCDERIDDSIMHGYCRFVKSNPTPERINLLKFYLASGIAESTGVDQVIQHCLKGEYF